MSKWCGAIAIALLLRTIYTVRQGYVDGKYFKPIDRAAKPWVYRFTLLLNVALIVMFIVLTVGYWVSPAGCA